MQIGSFTNCTASYVRNSYMKKKLKKFGKKICPSSGSEVLMYSVSCRQGLSFLHSNVQRQLKKNNRKLVPPRLGGCPCASSMHKVHTSRNQQGLISRRLHHSHTPCREPDVEEEREISEFNFYLILFFKPKKNL
jgi:hypothetical protein